MFLFFSKTDVILNIEILKNLSSKELFLDIRRISKELRKAAILTLLSRNNTDEDIRYQKQLMSLEYDMVLDDQKTTMNNLILTSVRSQHSDSEHKIWALNYLANANKITFDNDLLNECVAEIENNLDHALLNCILPFLTPKHDIALLSKALECFNFVDNYGAIDNYCSILVTLGSKFKGPSIQTIFNKLLPELNGKYVARVSNALTALAPQLSDEQRTMLVPVVIETYYAKDYTSGALKTLKAMLSKLTTEQVESCANDAISKFNSSSLETIRLARDIVKVLLPRLPPNTLNLPALSMTWAKFWNGDSFSIQKLNILSSVLFSCDEHLKKLETVDYLIYVISESPSQSAKTTAYSLLQNLVDKMSEDEVNNVFKLLERALLSHDSTILMSVLHLLPKIAKRLTESQIEVLLPVILTLMTTNNPSVNMSARIALHGLIPTLSTTQCTQLFTIALENMQINQPFNIRDNGVDILVRMESRLTLDQRNNILNWLTERLLDNNDIDFHSSALELLSCINVKDIMTDQINSIMGLVLQKLMNPQNKVSAHRALFNLIPHLTELERGKVFASLLRMLNDPNDNHGHIYNNIFALLPKVGEAHIDALLTVLLTQLTNEDLAIQEEAISMLGDIIPQLTPKQATDLVLLMLQASDGRSYNTHSEKNRYLAQLPPALTNVKILTALSHKLPTNELLPILIHELNSQHHENRLSALNMIIAILVKDIHVLKNYTIEVTNSSDDNIEMKLACLIKNICKNLDEHLELNPKIITNSPNL